MESLPIAGVSAPQRDIARYAAALVHALARDEAAGRRPRRLLEPELKTWTRFRGRLSDADFIRLLFEDAAAIEGFQIPFDATAMGLRLDRLPESVARGFLQSLPELDIGADGADYITTQARCLGLPTRIARSNLHVVKAHQKVLELPGTGGQLAHHLVSTQEEVSLQDNITVACSDWRERTMAGIVALDLGAPDTRFAAAADARALRAPDNPLRRQRFDFVVGLHPDKGGLFQASNQLDIWFAGARILLV